MISYRLTIYDGDIAIFDSGMKATPALLPSAEISEHELARREDVNRLLASRDARLDALEESARLRVEAARVQAGYEEATRLLSQPRDPGQSLAAGGSPWDWVGFWVIIAAGLAVVIIALLVGRI